MVSYPVSRPLHVCAETSTSRPQESSLEAVLAHLSLYGSPRLSMIDDKWFCKVEMKVTFEIKSEFNNSKPIEAALQCLDRMNDALRKLEL